MSIDFMSKPYTASNAPFARCTRAFTDRLQKKSTSVCVTDSGMTRQMMMTRQMLSLLIQLFSLITIRPKQIY